LTTHGTSYLGLIMRLGGVYETRGDSLSPRLWSVTKVEEQPLSVLSAILGYVWIFIVLLLSLLSFAFG
ncbi:hypothetical protein QVM52_27490, partial [Pseudomonas mosselii]|uniref:hypothetical protein n=1 Tax=Pseudomonas mosselii TaxID=78327 RepID=UPI001E28D3FE